MNVASASLPFPIRQECPPGACVCGREELLADPAADVRVLRLTAMEEKKLVARLEAASSYDDLLHVAALMEKQLGIVMTIRPSERGVRTVRGIIIHLQEQPGLCRKTRQAIPAAVRRCLEQHPEIAWAIVDAHDLLGGASGKPRPN
jgi:hypothetical protein